MVIPTLESLKQSARSLKSFPTYLTEVDNALVVFASAFFGLSDVIYFIDVENVCLVDNDVEKMGLMKDIYPPSWDFIIEDAFETISNFASQGRKYDVVSCDPWTPTIPRVLIDEFDKFYEVAEKYLVIRATGNSFFMKNNIEPNEVQIAKFLSSRHQKDIKVKQLIKDCGFDGGSYKIVIEKGE